MLFLCLKIFAAAAGRALNQQKRLPFNPLDHVRAPTHTTVQCALLAPHATPCTRPRALALSKVGLNLLFNSKIMIYPPCNYNQRVNVPARNVGFC